LKFDAEGNWKIVKTHQMPKKEMEKGDAAEIKRISSGLASKK
jgi:hypothetical protein